MLTPNDLRKPELPGPWKPLAYRGSQGATFYEPEDVAEGKLEIEEGNLWTEGKLAVWKPEKKGDTLTLKIPVEKAGKYQLRVGVAYGPVLALLGDVFGTTVNRASRLTSFARPGTVLIDEALAAQLKDEEGFQVVAVRARHAHGLGQLQPYALRRSFGSAAAARG